MIQFYKTTVALDLTFAFVSKFNSKFPLNLNMYKIEKKCLLNKFIQLNFIHCYTEGNNLFGLCTEKYRTKYLWYFDRKQIVTLLVCYYATFCCWVQPIQIQFFVGVPILSWFKKYLEFLSSFLTKDVNVNDLNDK